VLIFLGMRCRLLRYAWGLLFTSIMPLIPAQAGVLGSAELTNDGIDKPGVFPFSLWLGLAISPNPNSPFSCFADSPPSCYGILSYTFTTADIGSTISANSSNNPEFSAIAGILTNGAENNLGLAGDIPGPPPSDPGGGFGIPESLFFPNGGGPDFEGSTLTQIDLTLNKLVFASEPLINFGDGLFTVANFDVTVTVEGNTPEPGVFWTAGTGLVLLLVFRTRANRSYCAPFFSRYICLLSRITLRASLGPPQPSVAVTRPSSSLYMVKKCSISRRTWAKI
jgi:hypothetical protein